MIDVDTLLQLLIENIAHYQKSRQDGCKYLEDFLNAIIEKNFEFGLFGLSTSKYDEHAMNPEQMNREKAQGGGGVGVHYL